jgi:hypothetical protein
MEVQLKVEELINQYSFLRDCFIPSHREQVVCAIVAVDLHLAELSKMKLIFSDRELHYKFWQEVKSELLNLK